MTRSAPTGMRSLVRSSVRFRRPCRLLPLLLAAALLHAPLPAAADERVSLNFVNADLESIAKAVGAYLERSVIVDPRVKGSASLVSERPVSRAEALQALYGLLRVHGYAVVEGAGFIKVVPEPEAKNHAAPIAVAASANAGGDRLATQVFRLGHESAAQAQAVLKPILSTHAAISAQPGNNTLVITDYAENLKRAAQLIASLDQPAASELDVLPLRHALAIDLAPVLLRLFDDPRNSGANGDPAARLSIAAEPRSNAIVVRAGSLARLESVRSAVARLDRPLESGSNVHVIHLKNADAVRLAATLRGSGMVDAANAASAANTAPAPAGGMLAAASPMAAPPPAAAAAAAAPLPGGIQIHADAASNSLIVTAPEAAYRNLRTIVDRLDSRRAQVYIESLIVEVSNEVAAEFGVQWTYLSKNGDSRFDGLAGTNLGASGSRIGDLVQAAVDKKAPAVLPGLVVGGLKRFSSGDGLGVLIRALERDGRTNILSTPNLTTLDNEEARIVIGQNVPFVTGRYVQTANAGGVTPFQTIERKDVGLALKVRPQISEGGTVRLQISQEVSSVDEKSLLSTEGIITNKRAIDTAVLVEDGETIVLGGLLADSFADGEEKVPGLGDLPVLGNLFRYDTRKRTKSNLMVFLRPVVMRSAEATRAVSGDRYDYILGAADRAQPQPRFALPDSGRVGLSARDGDGSRVRQPSPETAPAPVGSKEPQ